MPQTCQKITSWLRFEHDVAKLFGYIDVTHNAELEGGNVDVYMKLRKRNKPTCGVGIKFS